MKNILILNYFNFLLTISKKCFEFGCVKQVFAVRRATSVYIRIARSPVIRQMHSLLQLN